MKPAKAYLNILKLRCNMRLHREVIHNHPIFAFIDTTSFCNLGCPSCPTGLKLGLRPSMAMEEDLFRAAIDDVGDYIFHMYMYNWGEPLLNKRTPEMVRYAKDREIKVTISTNLSMPLTDDYIERLVRSGLDRLMVSLDGTTAETYEQYRKKGDFSRVRENLRRINAARHDLGMSSPRLVWQFIVFRHNEHQVDEARALCREWGADEVRVDSAILPLESHRAGLEPSTVPEFNRYHPDHPVQVETKRVMSSSRPCSWLYGGLVLSPGGQVSPCCGVPAEDHDFARFTAGGSVVDALNSDRFRKARGLSTRTRPAPTSLPMVAQSVTKLNDGMGAGMVEVLEDDEIVCEKCPVPSIQRYTDPIIQEIVDDLVSGGPALGEPTAGRSRRFVNYLLMGAPRWERRVLKRIAPRSSARAAAWVRRRRARRDGSLVAANSA